MSCVVYKAVKYYLFIFCKVGLFNNGKKNVNDWRIQKLSNDSFGNNYLVMKDTIIFKIIVSNWYYHLKNVLGNLKSSVNCMFDL